MLLFLILYVCVLHLHVDKSAARHCERSNSFEQVPALFAGPHSEEHKTPIEAALKLLAATRSTVVRLLL
eukprot:1397475-Alexandrium_andersonii.AAC.1